MALTLKTYSLIIIIISIALNLILTACIYADNNEEEAVASWFSWKIKHLDNDEQKKVIKYFEELNPVFEKSENIVWRPIGSSAEYPDPYKAVKIVDDSLSKITKIVPPPSCKEYHRLTIEILNNIKDYQFKRIESGTGEAFESRIKQDSLYEVSIRNIKIEELRLEEQRNKEYFKILHKIGFYDNALNEMSNLKLITKEEMKRLEKEKK